MTPQHVLILGSGAAGAAAARTLASRDDVRVTLVTRTGETPYTRMLIKVLASTVLHGRVGLVRAAAAAHSLVFLRYWIRVDGWVLVRHFEATLVNPRRRRLLPTTKTLENAIAAPASMGLSMPSAATGIAAVL